jgi:hypothetical protein
MKKARGFLQVMSPFVPQTLTKGLRLRFRLRGLLILFRPNPWRPVGSWRFGKATHGDKLQWVEKKKNKNSIKRIHTWLTSHSQAVTVFDEK